MENRGEPDGEALEFGHRSRRLEALAREDWDLLIVGGGITGAALAFLATHARPALRVALVERHDLASGTSSRSSRLLHGGLRYLAQGRVGLVRALLEGRRELARLAPHLAQPAPFLLPTQGPALKARAGLRLYAALAGDLASMGTLSRSATLAREPALSGRRLAGALTYAEISTHDARLVLELALGAAEAGAVVVPRIDCVGLVPDASGRVRGARLRDAASGEGFVARAKVVVNATGPWCDSLLGKSGNRPRVRLSRGSHVVLAPGRLPLRHTVVMFSPRDGRALFASPRDGFVLLGTTECEHGGPPETAVPTAVEVAYLLEAAAVAFPDARLGPRDVVTAFSGVRPLAAGRQSEPGSLDRGYVVRLERPGLLSICGGKLTLALAGARQALEKLSQARRFGPDLGLPHELVFPSSLPLLPGARPPAIHHRQALERLLPPASVARMLAIYGGRVSQLLPLLEAHGGREPLVAGVPHMFAEWEHARRFEEALTFEDFARRRGDLLFLTAVRASHRAETETAPSPSASPPLHHRDVPGRAA